MPVGSAVASGFDVAVGTGAAVGSVPSSTNPAYTDKLFVIFVEAKSNSAELSGSAASALVRYQPAKTLPFDTGSLGRFVKYEFDFTVLVAYKDVPL